MGKHEVKEGISGEGGNKEGAVKVNMKVRVVKRRQE